jgi:O-antigen ligase
MPRRRIDSLRASAARRRVPADARHAAASALSGRERVQLGLIVAAIAWGALAFGGVYAWAYRPLAVVCVGCGVIGFLSPTRRTIPRPIVLALAAVACAVLVQQLPISRAALARISPATVDVLSRFDVPFASGLIQHHAVSIAPGQTWTGLMLLAAFGIFCLGLVVSLRGALVIRLVQCLTGVSAGIAAIAIAQIGAGTGKVYGFWQPEFAGAPFGPFINRNHCAGWLVMSALAGFGYFSGLMARASRRRSSSWRERVVWLSTPEASRLILVGGALVIVTLAILFSASRSGIVSMAVGLMALVTLRAARLGRAARVGFLISVSLVVALCVGWAGADGLARRFGTLRDDSLDGRLGAWRDAMSVARRFPVAGTGLNTFDASMLFYQTTHVDQIYTAAHNDYLQLAAEGGILLAGPVLLLMGVTALGIHRRFADRADGPIVYWVRAGAVSGLLAIAAQEAVDFSLQMPGNAVLFCMLAAIALHRPASLSPARH